MASTSTDRPARTLDLALWALQILFFLLYAGTAVWKLATPRAEIAAMIGWAGDVPGWFLVVTALADLAGGLGVLLPAATRVAPWLTPVAAGGLAVLQAAAVAFHVARGEAADVPFNVVLLVLALVLVWGRGRKAPIRARS